MKKTDLVTLADGEDRYEWLAARKGVITATQAAAIAGSHPYYKLIDVWNEHTDPEWQADEAQFRWTQQYVDNGIERESAIIEWASADPKTGGEGNPFTASKALVRAVNVPPNHASTPDGIKYARDGVLVLVEAKTAQKRWDETGVPQHVIDQMEWQLYTTGAVTVWLAAEFYEWKGRGRNKVPTLVGKMLKAYQSNPARLAFLLEKVAEFEQFKRDLIAPESDLDLTGEAVEVDFDDDEQTAADKIEAAHIAEEMDEAAEIKRRIAPDLARLAEIDATVKTYVKTYQGRRIHLASTQLVAKLIRGTRTVVATSELPEDVLNRITSWSSSETVKLELNPAYTPTPTESETTE